MRWGLTVAAGSGVPRVVRPEFATFLHSELDDFLRDETLEKNLNYGENWATRLSTSATQVAGNEVNRDRVLWVLQHCLSQRDGSLAQRGHYQ